MPRTTVADFSIEHVQVLDADGNVDTALEPEISDDTLGEMYRTMKLARRLDERAVALQRRGELGTYAPAQGQEAAQVASASVLRDEDWMVPAFREVPAYLARGAPVHALLWYALGMEEGAETGDGRDMPPSISVGTQPLHAAGLGWAEAIKGTDSATLTYFGDGATSEGDVMEALNLAGVFDTQTVFLCQNNQYAISVPRERQTRAQTIAQKAILGGIHGVQVDGNDPLGVYRVTAEALEHARGGDPVLVEALTYRRSMHTTADDPSVYRTPEEEEEWDARDPIPRFETYLRGRGLLDDERVATVEEEIEAEIEEGIERARKGHEDLDPADMFEHAYSDLPPWVEKQRRSFESRGGRG